MNLRWNTVTWETWTHDFVSFFIWIFIYGFEFSSNGLDFLFSVGVTNHFTEKEEGYVVRPTYNDGKEGLQSTILRLEEGSGVTPETRLLISRLISRRSAK